MMVFRLSSLRASLDLYTKKPPIREAFLLGKVMTG